MEEIWKDIEGYEGYYQVSNLGMVKSLYRIIDDGRGRKRRVYERILSASKGKNGYRLLHLCNESGNTLYTVHNLVFYTFNPDKKGLGLDINHIDGDKSNNVLSNLEAITRSANLKHSYKNNLHKGRERHPMAKLTEDKVSYIKENLHHKTDSELALEMGVIRQTINQIRLGKTWKEKRRDF
jgi:DNA-binding XRE family transcriptional regulator